MAQLGPFPKFRAFNSNGAPLAGGKLHTFDAGTSTPRATYTDQGGGTPNANPVVLDANGEADVWLDGNYKLRLDDASDVVQWTVDNIQQFNTTVNETLSPDPGANAAQLSISGTINEAASGTHVLLAGVNITAPTIGAGAAAVTETATLYVNAAPSAAGATNYAVHVDAGATQLDGTLDVDGTVTCAGALNVFGLATFDGGLDVATTSTFDSDVTVASTLDVQGTLAITTGAPVVEITDTDAASDAAATAQIHLGRTADLDLGVLGYTAADAHLEMTNNISGGNIELRTTSGTVHVLETLTVDGATTLGGNTAITGTLAVTSSSMSLTGATPIVATNASTATTDTEIIGELQIGRVGTTAGRIGFLSASDVHMDITNTLAAGNLRLNTNAGLVQVDSDLEILHTGTPKLILRDTGTAVDTAVQALLELQDSSSAVMAQIGMASASDGTLEITNNIGGANLELKTATTGDVVLQSPTNATLILQDTGNAGTASRGGIKAQDSAGVTVWRIETDSASDSHLTIFNQAASSDIELRTTSGDIVLLTLPTSDPTKAGALWNNAGVVNISAG